MLFGLGTSYSFTLFGSYCHVVPAEIFGELGVVGLSIFILFVVASYSTGVNYIRDKRVPRQVRVTLGLLLCMFTLDFILCFKQGYYLGSTLIFLLGISVSILSSLAEENLRQMKKRKSLKSFSEKSLSRVSVTNEVG